MVAATSTQSRRYRADAQRNRNLYLYPIPCSSPSLCPSITPTKSGYAELYNLCRLSATKIGRCVSSTMPQRFQGGWQAGESGLGPVRKTSRITSSGLPDASGFKGASTPGPEMVGWSHKVACSSPVARCIFHVRLPVAPSMPRVHGLARFGATGDVDPGAGTPCSFRRNPR
jgi:hypothetical protein